MTNKPKVAASTPAALAKTLIADLGNGEETWNGDRTSTYFIIARGIGQYEHSKVYSSLIEEKVGLPTKDWSYSLHIINNIDGTNCEFKHTDSLDEQELVSLLGKVLTDIGCSNRHKKEGQQ